MRELRKYQKDDVQQIIGHLSNDRSCIYNLATGGGKTVVAAEVAKEAWINGYTIWIVTHRSTIYDSIAETFGSIGLNPLQVPRIQVFMVGMLRKYLKSLTLPDFVFFDECHHLPAKEWHECYQFLREKKVVVFGMTATPNRLDGKNIWNYFDSQVKGKQCFELIEEGFLSEYDLYTPDLKTIDFSQMKIPKIGSEMSKADLMRFAPSFVCIEVLDAYEKYCKGMSNISFVYSLEQARNLSDEAKDRGIRAVALTPDVTSHVLKRLSDQLAYKEIDMIISVDRISEGTDIPSCESVIVAMKTMSQSKIRQMWGRGLRKKKKPAILLDCGGNVHTLKITPKTPDNWDFFHTQVHEKETVTKIRLCKSCDKRYEFALKICPHCGAEFTSGSRERKKAVKVDGEITIFEKARKESL
jgi:DNA repair protein RadD